MALQSSGAISLDDIHQEAGGSANSSCTINDSDIRDMIDKSSGATMAFNEWYGASSGLSGDIGVITYAFAAGSGDTASKASGYVTITSTGDAQDFSDLVGTHVRLGASHANATRGIVAGGESTNPAVNPRDDYQYTTIASQADFADFGDLIDETWACSGVGNSTRRGVSGGSTSSDFTNKIEYVTIGSTGNGTDFGDQSVKRYYQAGNVNSTTRGCYSGGSVPGVGATSNIIDYITIASAGNATDFGNLNHATNNAGGCSSSTRGVISEGTGSNNRISYITIASTGNSSVFGTMTTTKNQVSGCSNATRGLFVGGLTRPIDYITIGSLGNAADFGDLLNRAYQSPCFSNSHGGL